LRRPVHELRRIVSIVWQFVRHASYFDSCRTSMMLFGYRHTPSRGIDNTIERRQWIEKYQA